MCSVASVVNVVFQVWVIAPPATLLRKGGGLNRAFPSNPQCTFFWPLCGCFMHQATGNRQHGLPAWLVGAGFGVGVCRQTAVMGVRPLPPYKPVGATTMLLQIKIAAKPPRLLAVRDGCRVSCQNKRSWSSLAALRVRARRRRLPCFWFTVRLCSRNPAWCRASARRALAWRTATSNATSGAG